MQYIIVEPKKQPADPLSWLLGASITLLFEKPIDYGLRMLEIVVTYLVKGIPSFLRGSAYLTRQVLILLVVAVISLLIGVTYLMLGSIRLMQRLVKH